MAAGENGDRAGLILAGGRSRRFGETDKALAGVGGRPLLDHVATRLSAVVDRLLVSCRPEQTAEFEAVLADVGRTVDVIEDPIPDRGPAAGIEAGLRAAPGPYVAVVACDNPLVDPAFVDHLFERAAGSEAAVPRVGGRLQPTHAVYRTDAMRAACEDVLSNDSGSLLAAVDELHRRRIAEEEVLARTTPENFLDVNTPSDLERVRWGPACHSW